MDRVLMLNGPNKMLKKKKNVKKKKVKSKADDESCVRGKKL